MAISESFYVPSSLTISCSFFAHNRFVYSLGLEGMMATYHVIRPQGRKDTHSGEVSSESPESLPSDPTSSSHGTQANSNSASPQAPPNMNNQGWHTHNDDGMWMRYVPPTDDSVVPPHGNYGVGHKAEWESSLDMFGLSERMAVAENNNNFLALDGWDVQVPHSQHNEQAFGVDKHNNFVPTAFS